MRGWRFHYYGVWSARAGRLEFGACRRSLPRVVEPPSTEKATSSISCIVPMRRFCGEREAVHRIRPATPARRAEWMHAVLQRLHHDELTRRRSGDAPHTSARIAESRFPGARAFLMKDPPSPGSIVLELGAGRRVGKLPPAQCWMPRHRHRRSRTILFLAPRPRIAESLSPAGGHESRPARRFHGRRGIRCIVRGTIRGTWG
jgi:hypothetical protein